MTYPEIEQSLSTTHRLLSIDKNSPACNLSRLDSIDFIDDGSTSGDSPDKIKTFTTPPDVPDIDESPRRRPDTSSDNNSSEQGNGL